MVINLIGKIYREVITTRALKHISKPKARVSCISIIHKDTGKFLNVYLKDKEMSHFMHLETTPYRPGKFLSVYYNHMASLFISPKCM